MTITVTPVTVGQAAVGASVPAVAAAPALPEPDWCLWTPCTPDRHDGSRMHMSPAVDVPTAAGTGLLDVRLCQLDEETEAGQTQVSLNVGRNLGSMADLTPEQALVFIEVVRDHLMTAAGPAGVPMPVERVRLGDELLTPDGNWEVVEIVDVDGWLYEGHPSAVSINTAAHSEDEEHYRYPIGTPVRVRKAVS
ncbi:hypothetical protein O7626_40825 [Micromonospora sp. WMMD1102]|uniref:DUF6907 domain-containing protein n=1 Tax=Micromonospora sp. WMMD1102 TaxID=3016105 RepID=UPI00241527FC|nr:hypothetical protein [Micromonospora sp. WMMD1102]MDG4790346.1 hypothetical protein [Micromonospora sp. WMMD1102]MDG4792149.1 hypothetical protein [Micromonospora sp. WMMD1102]